MHWMYLYFYQLQLDCLSIATAGGDTHAIAVYDSGSNAIVQCNLAASRQGLKKGMGLATASAMCPELQLITYDTKIEQHRLESIANALYLVVSDIVLCSHNAIAIKLDNMLTYYDGIEALLATLANQLRRQRLHYHYATAWSIEAAQVLALSGLNKVSMNTRSVTAWLQACPLTLCQLSEKQQHALHRVGIRKVGDILSISTQEISKRFSNSVIHYLAALKGETYPKVVFYHPKDTFFSSLELPFELEKMPQLSPWFSRLLAELETYLVLRNQLTNEIQLTLTGRDSENHTIRLNAMQAINRAEDWLSLLTLKCESLVLSAPIQRIALCCTQLSDITEQKADFFSQRQHHFAHLQLIGHLQAKLGESQITQPLPSDDHRPEKQTTSKPNVGPLHSKVYAPYAPSLLTSTPRPLEQTSRIIYGPRRLQTAWWDTPVFRDYFVAEDQHGQYLWVYRTKQQQWFIQGWYS